MKNVAFIIAAFTLTFMSFTKTTNPNLDAKLFARDFVKVKGDLYVSKFEVSNLDFRTFLSDLIATNKMDTYNKCLPDTLVWKNELVAAESLIT